MAGFDALFLTITQWSIGFSLFALLLCAMAFWWIFQAFEKTWLSKCACTLMLAALAGLQIMHWQALTNPGSLFDSTAYKAALFISAPSFYLFSRELLQFNNPATPLALLHFLPVTLSPWVPGFVAVPLAFCIGSGYALWLCLALYRLRAQRQYFQLELATFSVLGIIAVVIFLIGLLAPVLGIKTYLVAYSNLIAAALFAVLYLQLRFPDITQKTCDAVAASYAASTLKNADCDSLVKQLTRLLAEDKVYRDENLSLAQLAELMGLSSHQTSELINTQFNLGFARLVRQYRVEEAKQQLVNEPRASVLSIGLAVGFSSQSNFYSAFRELTGESPGQYRKRLGVGDA